MAEVPEHLLKRSAERRKQLGLGGDGGDDAPAETPAADAPAETPAETPAPVAASTSDEGAITEDKGGVPAHLLERSRKRKAAMAGGGGGDAGGGAVAAAAVATAPIATPTGTGPGGHTQRLLTVVKSGSIQQTRAEAQDKVHTWPHLLVGEFVAMLSLMALVTIFSALVRAPLLEQANFNQTPNPSKAPWYFLGLQELLTIWHPMVAGVTIPGMGLIILMMAPYIDKNPKTHPDDRKFAICLFTLFLMFWAVLVIIGSFFRGPGFNFVYPWKAGTFFDL